MNIYIYEIEVFKNDWLVVFRNPERDNYIVIHNNNYQLKEFLNQPGVVIGGFNTKGYDDWIILTMLNGGSNLEVKKHNDFIINGGNGWEFPFIQYQRKPFKSFDLRDDLPKDLSLKAIEGNNKGYYVNNTTKYLPKFAAGTMITLEMVKQPNTTVSIKKVLLNAKEIGTSTRVQFEMPTGTEIGETAAIVTFETSTLASLTGKVTSKTGNNEQVFTYDGNAHPFEYVVNPSGLTGFTVKYTKQGQAENYTTTAPTAVGTYDVQITRKADASYAEFTSEKVFSVKINPATPTITTAPTVTVTTDGDYSISGGKAQVGGKDVAGEWTVIDTENGDKAITKCSKTISHLATVAFLPTDKSNLNGSKNASDIVSNAATVQVAVKIGDTALSTYKVTATNIPSDMSLTFWNGANEVKSGSSVRKGTNLTIKLTYPAGYSGVKIKENKANGQSADDTDDDGKIEWEYNTNGTTYGVTAALDVTVIYSGSAKTITPVIDKPAVVSYTYDGNVHTTETTAGNDALFNTEDFEISNTVDDADEEELQKQMTITYKDAKGNTVVAPVNAGEYTVVVTIPEVKTANATYKAVTQEFEKLYVINKKEYTVDENNMAPTSQLTSGRKDITLITCTNDSKNRVIVKATEVI